MLHRNKGNICAFVRCVCVFVCKCFWHLVMMIVLELVVMIMIIIIMMMIIMVVMIRKQEIDVIYSKIIKSLRIHCLFVCLFVVMITSNCLLYFCFVLLLLMFSCNLKQNVKHNISRR